MKQMSFWEKLPTLLLLLCFYHKRGKPPRGIQHAMEAHVIIPSWNTFSVATWTQLYMDPSSDFQIEYLISLLKQKFGDYLINLTSFFFGIRTNLNTLADKHHFRNILILINGFLKCLRRIISIDACLILNSCSPGSCGVGTGIQTGRGLPCPQADFEISMQNLDAWLCIFKVFIYIYFFSIFRFQKENSIIHFYKNGHWLSWKYRQEKKKDKDTDCSAA